MESSLLDRAMEAYERLAKLSVWDELTDCLLWVGGNDGKGYGRFMLRGKNVRLHRLVWELKHGPIGSEFTSATNAIRLHASTWIIYLLVTK